MVASFNTYRAVEIVQFGLYALLALETAANAQCVGDCDRNGAVTVSDLVLGVNIVLCNQPATACTALQAAGCTVNITELIRAVNHLLGGCPSATQTPVSNGSATPTHTVTPASADTKWLITSLPDDIAEAPFDVVIDGVAQGSTEALAFLHHVSATTRFPQVLVLYSSGHIRVKAGEDPNPPLPFGQNLVLGPAIFGTSTSFPSTTLFFNPQVQAVSVDTSQLDPDGKGDLPIHITAQDENLPAGSCVTNQIMNLEWNVTLHEPTAEGTLIEVAGKFRFTEAVTPDPVRTAEAQSFRLLQVKSMFIDSDQHDTDAFRFGDADGSSSTFFFDPSQAGSLLPSTPDDLDPSTAILDSLHTDDFGQPNGNTPSYRIRLAQTTGPMFGFVTPRAYFDATDDLNEDNLGLWLHQRPLDSIPAGTLGTISYSLLATTDPLPAP